MARLPGTGAVAVVVAAMLAVGTALTTLLASAAVRHARRLGRDARTVLDDPTRLPVVGRLLREDDVPAQAQCWLDELPEPWVPTLTRSRAPHSAPPAGPPAGAATRVTA